MDYAEYLDQSILECGPHCLPDGLRQKHGQHHVGAGDQDAGHVKHAHRSIGGSSSLLRAHLDAEALTAQV